MAEEIDFEKCNFRNLEARDLDLDLESGHTAYHHVSLIDLYVQSDKLFVDGRTDVPTDGRTFPPLMLLGRLGGVHLKIATKN